jgi:hypothetical protein
MNYKKLSFLYDIKTVANKFLLEQAKKESDTQCFISLMTSYYKNKFFNEKIEKYVKKFD